MRSAKLKSGQVMVLTSHGTVLMVDMDGGDSLEIDEDRVQLMYTIGGWCECCECACCVLAQWIAER